jgi:hypothetical protein
MDHVCEVVTPGDPPGISARAAEFGIVRGEGVRRVMLSPKLMRGAASLAGGLVWLALCLGGCRIDRSGLAQTSSGDAAPRDGSRDGRMGDDGSTGDGSVDAGMPSCPEYGWTHRLTTLTGEEQGQGFFHPDAQLGDGLRVDDEARLRLAVQRYRFNGLWMRGYEDVLLGSPPSFSDISDARPVGSAFVSDMGQVFADAGKGPTPVRLSDEDDYTVVATGEIRLEQGSRTLEFSVDDRGLLDLRAGGQQVSLVAPDPSTPARMDVEIPEQGWYPIRFAYVDDGGTSRFALQTGPSGGSLQGVSPERLRVDASRLQGRDAFGFSGSLDGDPEGNAIVPGDGDTDFGNERIPWLGLDRDDWHIRLVGRTRFDAPEAGLDVRSEDAGHRVWVDGVFLGGSYDGDSLERTYGLAVDAGWHDTVIEVQESGGNARLKLEQDGSVLPAEVFRPYTRFGGRPWGAGTEPEVAVPNGETVSETLTLASGDRTPVAVEVSAVVQAAEPSQVQIEATRPSGDVVTGLMQSARRVPDSDPAVWWARKVVQLGGPAEGEWTITAEGQSEEEVTWLRAGVLAHQGGVRQGYPSTGTFTSRVFDLRQEVRITGVQLDAHEPPGTSVDVEVRTGAARDSLGNWTPAADSGPVGRFAQVRLTLRGGDDTPWVRSVGLSGAPCLCPEQTGEQCEGVDRTQEGLVVLYTFDGASGDGVTDRAPGTPLDLTVQDSDAVQRTSGTLTVQEPTMVHSRVSFPNGATKVTSRCQATDAITVEAWIEPAAFELPQEDPARIVTLSKDAGKRNFTLGQTTDRGYVLRLRTSPDRENGRPYTFTPSGLVQKRMTHVVFTRSSGGTVIGYVNGQQVVSSQSEGNFDGWNEEFHFALGNELDGNRGWLGTYDMVAVYNRALRPQIVKRHFDLGPDPD